MEERAQRLRVQRDRLRQKQKEDRDKETDNYSNNASEKGEESKVDRINKGLAALSLGPSKDEKKMDHDKQRKSLMHEIRGALIEGGEDDDDSKSKKVKVKGPKQTGMRGLDQIKGTNNQ